MTISQNDLDQASNNFSQLITLLGLSAELKAESDKDVIHLSVKTNDPGRLIGRRGQTLQALQHLLNGILLRYQRSFPKVFIDVVGQQTRDRPGPDRASPGLDRVRKSASDAVKEVQRWGERVMVTVTNDEERREVERIIKDYADVEIITAGDQRSNQMIVKLKE